MKKFYKRVFKRKDNKKLLLFSSKEHNENNTKELDSTASSSPHMRWHPFRQEWVSYSVGREKRTFFPQKEYCPF